MLFQFNVLFTRNTAVESFMRGLLLLCAGIAPLLAIEDPHAMVEKALRRDAAYYEIRQNYTYRKKTVEKRFDSKGVAESKSTIEEVLVLYDDPYERLIERDGKPLSTKEAQKEQEKLDRFTAERSGESEWNRQRRAAERRKKIQKERDFRAEILKAYNFRLSGERRIDGFDCYVIEADPRPDYHPTSHYGRPYNHFRGTFYLLKSDYSLVHLEAEVTSDLSFGLFLGRLYKGARFTLDMQRINNEIWFPLRIHLTAEGKLVLLKNLRIETDILYSDFRKFQSDSRIIPLIP